MLQVFKYHPTNAYTAHIIAAVTSPPVLCVLIQSQVAVSEAVIWENDDASLIV